MSDERNLVVVITSGPHEEKASIGCTIANGGMTAGMKVSIFLTGDGVDIVRKKSCSKVEFHPLDPITALIEDFLKRGGTLWACTPCVKARGYEQADLIDGTIITGASPMHELIKNGAATLCF